MSGIFTAFIVALVAGICEWDIYGFGHTQISRPLVVGPLIGLVLGDLQKGVLIGASIELIYLGTIAVGAAIPPDATAATSIATALAILSNLDKDVAVSLAIPVAVAAQMLQILIWTINQGILHKADKLVENAEIDKVARLQYIGSAIFFLQGFVPVFFAVLLGANAVSGFVDFLNNNLPFVLNGFKIAGGILPALGFAMLFIMMNTKKLMPYFIIGFILAAFFAGSLISVAGIGIAAAILYVNSLSKDDKKSKTKEAQ